MLQGGMQQLGSIDECVSVHLAEAYEMRGLQTGNHPEYALLLRVAQIGLESDQVVELARQVVLAQLDDRVRPLARTRIAQPDWSHRPKG